MGWDSSSIEQNVTLHSKGCQLFCTHYLFLAASSHPTQTRRRTGRHRDDGCGTGVIQWSIQGNGNDGSNGGFSVEGRTLRSRQWELGHAGQERQRNNVRRRLGGKTFPAAHTVAAITVLAVGVIALFGRIQHVVAAARVGTIGATAVGQLITVCIAVVTLFSRVDGSIAAEEREEAAVLSTAVRKIPVVERGFALLTLHLLEDAVAAAAKFQQAFGGAAIEVAAVAVVTFFTSGHCAVTATRLYAGFQRAPSGAAVAVAQVAIITAFPGGLHAIAAEVIHELTTWGAAVGGARVAIITLLSCLHSAVATTRPLVLASRRASIAVEVVAIVAIFSRGHHKVTAARRCRDGTEVAPVACKHVAVIALFTCLQNGIATAAGFPLTREGAAIQIAHIAIITRFPGSHDVVTAARVCRNQSATVIATVTVEQVSIVALFAGIQPTVSAARCCHRAATGRTAVIIAYVAIVALFTRVDPAVATDGTGADTGGSAR